jgi:hypothetical protein
VIKRAARIVKSARLAVTGVLTFSDGHRPSVNALRLSICPPPQLRLLVREIPFLEEFRFYYCYYYVIIMLFRTDIFRDLD